MMPNSQNGWPVVGTGSIVDKAVLGVEFPNGWLKGDVDVVFTDLITQLDKVEKIHKGWCWGYYVKNIEGSRSISNHASGTAIDYNAPNHPMGKRNTYSAGDRATIRRLLKERYEGVIRWGGDYTGRPDDMHFEIVGSRAAVARVADKLRKKEARKLELKKVTAVFPGYKEGDSDDDFPGYDRIRRMQKLLSITADGEWGPKTTKAVGSKTLTEQRWRDIFGIATEI